MAQRKRTALRKSAVIQISKDLGSTSLDNDFLETLLQQLSESPQFNMFPERAAFLKSVTNEGEERQCFSRFVSGLCDEYTGMISELSRIPVSVRFAEMQVQWLQHVRQIMEAGERLATSDAQDVEVGSDTTERHTELATCVASLCMGAFGESAVSTSSLLAVFHSIARHVFQYQQTRVLQMKMAKLNATQQKSTEDEEESFDVLYEDEEDSLYRICGAQMHRMIVKRSEMAGNHQAQTEITFLKQISMSQDEKNECLPVSLLSTKRGGRILPKAVFLPFIKAVVQSVREEINEENFKRFGERVFKVYSK